jgi:hypothetical protein
MRILSLLLTFTLFGCSSIKDVSYETPQNIKLNTAVLDKPAFLCRDTLGFFEPEINIELVVNYGFDKCQASKHVLSVPSGSEIQLQRLVEHTGYGLFVIKRWFIVGTYNSDGSEYNFVYHLDWVQDTDGTLEVISQPPWSNGI